MKQINRAYVQRLLKKRPTLIAVTKTVGVREMEVLYEEGVRHFGENRVETFLEKVEYFKDKDDIHWHYIGALQSRQVKKVIEHIDYFHALSSISVATEIEKHAQKSIKCFIQVNCSHEMQKSGLNPDVVLDFYNAIAQFEKIEIVGLMTMAAYTENQSILKETFELLKKVRNELNPNLKLSMGMSNDYQIAIDSGSDFVRIGSALFE